MNRRDEGDSVLQPADAPSSTLHTQRHMNTVLGKHTLETCVRLTIAATFHATNPDYAVPILGNKFSTRGGTSCMAMAVATGGSDLRQHVLYL